VLFEQLMEVPGHLPTHPDIQLAAIADRRGRDLSSHLNEPKIPCNSNDLD
jgi:hypothetical protein